MHSKKYITLVIIALVGLSAATPGQVPPHAFDFRQSNSDGDGWATTRVAPQPESVFSFDAARQPGTTPLNVFARASDLTPISSALGALQTQVAANTGNIGTLTTSLAGKENTGVASTLLGNHTTAANPHPQYLVATSLSNYALTADLTAAVTNLNSALTGKESVGIAATLIGNHTAAANPHTQYALASTLSQYVQASALSGYALITTLNSATNALTTAINAKAPLTHAHAQSDISGLASALAEKETAGTAATQLAGHTANPNPHPQYGLASAFGNYALVTTLNTATTSLTAQIAAKAPVTHAHAQADITGLATTLAAKENAGVAASLDAAHTSAANPHPQYLSTASLSGYALVTDLAGKADTTTLNTATNALTTAIAAKAALTHKHGLTDVTGLTTALQDQNSGLVIKKWYGTQAQYSAIATKDAYTEYNIYKE